MTELDSVSIEDLIQELKHRNISFLIAYCDHNEFRKSDEGGIVWGCDGGGNLVLQSTLLRFLRKWLQQIETVQTHGQVSNDP